MTQRTREKYVEPSQPVDKYGNTPREAIILAWDILEELMKALERTAQWELSYELDSCAKEITGDVGGRLHNILTALDQVEHPEWKGAQITQLKHLFCWGCPDAFKRMNEEKP